MQKLLHNCARPLAVILLAAMAWALAGCGEDPETAGDTGKALSFPSYDSNAPIPAPASLDPRNASSAQGVQCWAVGPNGRHAPDVQRALRVSLDEVDPETRSLNLRLVNAPELGAVLLYCTFDQSKLWVKKVHPGEYMGDPGERVFMAEEMRPGMLSIGLARVRPQDTGLVSGGGLVAQAILKTGGKESWDPQRPQNMLPAVDDLEVEDNGDGSVKITFEEHLPADLNNNGVVGLDDLPYLAAYWQERTDGEHASLVDALDINGDGLLDDGDLGLLEDSMYLRIDGFRIFEKGGEQPLPYLGGDNPVDASLSLVRTKQDLSPFRRPEYSYLHESAYDPSVALGRIPQYRVEPVDLYGGRTASGSAGGGFAGPESRQIPVWVGARGIRSAQPGEGLIKVTLGKARSRLGNDVGYRIYYSQKPFTDLDRADYVEAENRIVRLGEGGEPAIKNGTEYYLLGVAYDKENPASGTTNRNLTTVTPSEEIETDLDPPEFTGEAVTDVVAGNSAVRLEPGTAVDDESGLAGYRVYYQKGSSVDPLNALTEEFGPGEPVLVDNLTNGRQWSFLLRAYDNTRPPNESLNETAVSATPKAELPRLTPPEWRFRGFSGIRAWRPLEGGFRFWAHPGTTSTGDGEVRYRLEYREPDTSEWQQQTFSTPDELELTDLPEGKDRELRLRLVDSAGNYSAPVALGTRTVRSKLPVFHTHSFEPGRLGAEPGGRPDRVELTLPGVSEPAATGGAQPDGFHVLLTAIPLSDSTEAGATLRRIPRDRFIERSDRALRLDGLKPGVRYRFTAELVSNFPEFDAAVPAGELTTDFKLPVTAGSEGYLEGFSPSKPESL